MKALSILQINSARKYVGEAAHTLCLSEALRQAGHKVILCLRDHYPTYDVAKASGLEPVGLHLPHRLWPPLDLRDMQHLDRLVKEHGIQLIHAHRGKDHWLATLAVRCFRLRLPIVRTRHVVTPLRNHAANRWLAQRTARLVAVSRAVETDVLGSGVYAQEKVRLLPGGIDLRRFCPSGRRAEVRSELGIAPQATVAVCVARFAKVKAHRVLVEAWGQVAARMPEAVLLLVGQGAHLEAARNQARELGLNGSIRFLGRRTHEEIPGILEASDLGVLSSVGSEGFSRAVLEYLAVGLPVVATRVGAVPDLVEEDVNGWMVAPGEAAPLGEAMRMALQAPAPRRAAWGAAARRKAEAAHSYPIWASAHERLYREVLSEKAEAEAREGRNN